MTNTRFKQLHAQVGINLNCKNLDLGRLPSCSPDYYEFWQGRPNRLHDRLAYEKIESEWKLQRLMP